MFDTGFFCKKFTKQVVAPFQDAINTVLSSNEDDSPVKLIPQIRTNRISMSVSSNNCSEDFECSKKNDLNDN